ncbi:MAG: hypothetical protein ABFD52_05425 [Acidobacteriota bacterium]
MNLWKKILGLSWKFCLVVLGLYGLLKLFRETRLFVLNIPDWIFFIWAIFLSIILVITVDFVNKNRGTPVDDAGLKKEIEDLKKSLEDTKRGINNIEIEFRGKLNAQGETIARIHNAPKEYLLESSKEVLFILGVLARVDCEYLNRGGLLVNYERHFKGQEPDEFTAVIHVMRGNGLIRFYADNEEQIAITTKGSAYYLKYKERPKKENK